MSGSGREISFLNIRATAARTKEWSGQAVARSTSERAERAGGEHLAAERADVGKGGLFLERGRPRPSSCSEEQRLG